MEARKESRPNAYAQLQSDLMNNLGTLTAIATLKDLLTTNAQNEEWLKTDEGSKAIDPVEALERFLNAPSPTRQPVIQSDDEGIIQ